MRHNKSIYKLFVYNLEVSGEALCAVAGQLGDDFEVVQLGL